MLKPISAIMAAAFVAAAVTALTAPSGQVTAGPNQTNAEAMRSCAQRPWPYLNCVGTPFGNPQVRLVTTDRI